MRKWEYECVGVNGYIANERSALINQYAGEGWELVSVDDHYVYFKREILDSQSVRIQDANTPVKAEEYEDIKRQAKEVAPGILADLFSELAKAARAKQPNDSGPNSATANL